MRTITLFLFAALFWACKKDHKDSSCRFSAISYGGSTTKLPVRYSGDSVVTVGGNSQGYMLYYDGYRRLAVKEEPVVDPYYRYRIEYNSGRLPTALWFYTRQSGSWVSDSRLVFTYINGRMATITEQNQDSQSGFVYSHVISWQGNDIKSVEHLLNGQHQCTTTFSYDPGKLNPMRRFSDFYYVDGDANYVYYKLPYYFSEHLLTRQEGDCSLSDTRMFTYTFTSTGLIGSTSNLAGPVTNPIWVYEYECR